MQDVHKDYTMLENNLWHKKINGHHYIYIFGHNWAKLIVTSTIG